MDIQGKRNLSRVMHFLFSQSFIEGFIPDEWQSSVLVMIPKKGDLSDLNNYRGIAIINTLSKVFLKVIMKKIEKESQTRELISKHQIGVIPQEQALCGVMSAIEIVERRRNSNLTTYMCFLDLKKAYDMVCHDILLQKLKDKQIDPRVINILQSLYQKSSMQVRIDNTLSEAFPYERGVRQGCPTSPLCFDIFIDDILNRIGKIKVPGIQEGADGICFADDTLIFASSETDLKHKLLMIKEWMSKNRMEVNSEKSGILIIKPKEKVKYNKSIAKRLDNQPQIENWLVKLNTPEPKALHKESEHQMHQATQGPFKAQSDLRDFGFCSINAAPRAESQGKFIYDGREIPIKSHYSYLGVEINDKVSYERMAKYRMKTGWNTLESIKHVLRNKKVSLIYKRMLIRNVLLPRITYGIQIFGLRKKNFKEIKKMYSKAIAMMVGRSNLSKERIRQEFDLPSIEEIAFSYRIKSFKSWKCSKSIAKALIATSDSESGWNRKTTWCNSTQKWISKNNINIYEPAQKLGLDIRTVLAKEKKTQKRPKHA
jgi:hypothetical protein